MSLKRNSIWNLAGTGLPLLLGAITIPYLVKEAGVEAFGILTLIWALVGYFSLFDFGLGRALTQQVAASLAGRRSRGVPQLVKSGLIFVLLTGAVGALLLAAMAYPLGHDWLKISPNLQSEATWSLLIAALGIPLTTTTTGMRGVMEAYEDFKTVNLLRIALGLANFGLPALSVWLAGPSLIYMVATLIAARILVLSAYWMCLNRKLPYRWYSVKPRKKTVKRLLSFGAWMTVSNIISPLMVTADRFVIAAVLGAGAVAYYTVPFEVLIRVLVLPGALTAALFPRLASMLKHDPGLAYALYTRSLQIIGPVLAVVCGVIAVGSYWGLALWVSPAFAEESWLIASVLSLGILLNGIASVPFAMIQAAGDAKTTARLHIIEFILYVPLLLAALHLFGLVGAAIAWVCRVGLDLVLLLACVRKIAPDAQPARLASLPVS